ncbi:MAG: SpoIIE family protein phosphatase [Akkermansia sp.]|nr:SpoIIE family protein phosphatase [Akkermansia sp.]
MDARIAQWLGCREQQEDAYIVRHFPKGTLAIVCDGMGGHDEGMLAARKASETFAEFVSSHIDWAVPKCLRCALDAANESIKKLFAATSRYGGTTLLAVFAGGGVLRWISVGDSPLLIWRGSRLIRLNEDHSMRAIYRRQLGSSLAENLISRSGHMLRSAVTGEPLGLVDMPSMPYPLLPGDRIILASDGAEVVLDPAHLSVEMKRMLSNSSINLAAAIVEACRALNDAHADNTTVITIDCGV